MQLEDFRRIDVPTRDGLTVAAFDSGPSARADAETFFLVNGLGGNLATWRHLVQHFTELGHRVVTWDYRGLFASRFDPATAERDRRGDVRLDMEVHLDDALRVLDTLDVDRVVSFGWSMGVQLNWELLRHHGHRIAGVVQICGAAGKVIETTALGVLGARYALPAMDLFRRMSHVAAPVFARLVGSPLAIRAAAAFGMVAPTIDVDVARDIAREYVSLDFDVYNRILAGLVAADARDFLPRVDKPVLLVAGDRDVLTPVELSREMVRTIPAAELVVMDGGSHYLPIEFPDRLNQAVASFIARRLREARVDGRPADRDAARAASGSPAAGSVPTMARPQGD